jgi:hypothetical protein
MSSGNRKRADNEDEDQKIGGVDDVHSVAMSDER